MLADLCWIMHFILEQDLEQERDKSALKDDMQSAAFLENGRVANVALLVRTIRNSQPSFIRGRPLNRGRLLPGHGDDLALGFEDYIRSGHRAGDVIG